MHHVYHQTEEAIGLMNIPFFSKKKDRYHYNLGPVWFEKLKISVSILVSFSP
jgi:hypothetical protein